MDPIKQFSAERMAAIAGYGTDEAFTALSSQWRQMSMDKRYVYNFDWMGRPIIQYPQDIQAMQELVWATKPDLIIETGIAHGGSIVLSASLLAMLDMCDAIEKGVTIDPKVSNRKVIGIDIDIRKHNRKAIEEHPMASRIQLIEGSSIAKDVVDQVQQAAQGYERVMVCLDSMHTHDHVLAELEAYAPSSPRDATAWCSIHSSRTSHGTSSMTVRGTSATTPRRPCAPIWRTIPNSASMAKLTASFW